MVDFLKRETAPDLAYIYYKGNADLPTIMFLGGFRSDMMGTKAQFLDETCRNRNQSFIRFDYRGHGQSEGIFEESCISEWTQDAQDILDHCAKDNSIILVGSSMGGWISLLLALKNPDKLKALIGLAAAPDFTTWMEEGMSESQKQVLESEGFFALENDYSDPYIITKKLLEDGRQNKILDKPIALSMPVHLIQGKKDQDVPWQTAETIKSQISGSNVEITYIENADHRLSTPAELNILDEVVEKYS